MRDLFILLVLLSVQSTKAYANENVCNETEYLKVDSNLCCKRCQPGYRLKDHCSENRETVCEPCQSKTFLENWNYAPNCLACKKCSSKKYLKEIRACTSTQNAVCVCEEDTYCTMGYNAPECTGCKMYRKCGPGHGVSVQGTPDSDVKCQECPTGTFSNISSYSEKCKPHTDCKGRVRVKGDATSDNICEDEAAKPSDRTTPRAPFVVFLTSTEANHPETTSDVATPHEKQGFTQTSSYSASYKSSPTAKSLYTTTQSDIGPVVIPTSVVGMFLLLISVSLLVFYNRRRADTAVWHPKVDANGNCESGGKVAQSNTVEHQTMGLTFEHQCLLGKSEASSDESPYSSDTLTKLDDSTSNEPNSLHSVSNVDNPASALSEPMTLQSDPEAVTPQPSISAQPSSQPTSPHIVSPVTSSPHVNVNITVHIGNGSYQTVNPIDSRQAECQPPFEDGDWSVSSPKQEEGEQTRESVPESGGNSTYCFPK